MTPTERRPVDVVRFSPFRTYRPHRHQRAFHALRLRWRKRFRVAVCGRRGGKTVAGAADFVDAILRDVHAKRNGLGRFAVHGPQVWEPQTGADPTPYLYYWVLAPTTELLGEPKSRLQAFLGLAEDGGLILSQNRSKGIWWLRNGIRIDFRSCERPELLVSRGLDGFWMDEAARCKEAVWLDNLPATVADKQGWGLFTTTPVGRNWVWRHLWCLGDRVEAAMLDEDDHKLDPDFACIRWRTHDNTAVPGLAAEAERQRKIMPVEMWRRNYEASFSAFKGQCFNFLSASTHLTRNVDWIPEQLEDCVAGFDSGWTHPGCLTVWGLDHGGHFRELETVTLRHTPLYARNDPGWAGIAQRLYQKWHFRTLSTPPDDPEAYQQFQDAGLPVRGAYTDRLAGMQWFQMALFNGNATISTPGVYHSFEGLRHPENRTGREAELWIKTDDDQFDASRYALSEWIQRGKLRATRGVRHGLNILRR